MCLLIALFNLIGCLYVLSTSSCFVNLMFFSSITSNMITSVFCFCFYSSWYQSGVYGGKCKGVFPSLVKTLVRDLTNRARENGKPQEYLTSAVKNVDDLIEGASWFRFSQLYQPELNFRVFVVM